MSLKPVVTGMWIGDRLSTLERLCIKSFTSHGYDFQLYVYNDVKNVPQETTLKDGSEILPREKTALAHTQDMRGIAYFSDLFRYKMLYEMGGWWVDMDTVCLKEIALTDEPMVGSEGRPERKSLRDRLTGQRRFKNRSFANIGFLKFPAQTEVMNYCFVKSEEILTSNKTIRWGDTGPVLLRSALKKFGKQHYVIPWKTYCPVHLWNWKDFLDPEKTVSLERLKNDPDVYCVHLWNELWRRGGVDKNQKFPESTYISHLLRKYGVDPKTNEA